MKKDIKTNDEAMLVAALKKGSQPAFVVIFKTYYSDLVQFAGTFIPEREMCEDIVQTVFLRLWEHRELLTIDRSIKSFLLKSVQNACLDEIRRRKVQDKLMLEYDPALADMVTEKYVLFSELQQNYAKALDRISPVERQVFVLSRIQGRRYAEIAEMLGVSVRTVEVRMSHALSHLRKILKDYLLSLTIFILIIADIL